MLKIPVCGMLFILGEVFTKSLADLSVPTWMVCRGRLCVPRSAVLGLQRLEGDAGTER